MIVAAVGLLLLAAADGSAAFVRAVRPLLRAKCLACHGDKPDDLKGGLDLRTAKAARAGGDGGTPVVVPGKPDDSPLYLAARRDHADWSAMPPKENDRLSAEQLKAVRDWIAAGAGWPDAAAADAIAQANADAWSAADGVTVKTSGGLSAEWTDRRYKPADLWAYRPLARPTPPAAGHPVDAFIDAGLKAKGVSPAPPADRRALVRRVTFDLTGLPPTPAEVEAFVSDPGTDDAAYAKLIDRLLASPHYGEKMARHWLDVARYADSAGLANDYDRGPAWRYRDYVVRAFAADKRYDQFVREQIAGDEINPADPEKLVAVGFLRMGPWELTGMEVPRVARQRFLDDVTDAVGQAFLGHTLQCARCHDHKFDPVPTRDYYRVQAAFAGTQIADRPAAFLPAETAGDAADDRRYLAGRRAEYEAELARLDGVSLAAADAWFAAKTLDPARFRKAVEQQRAGQGNGRPRTAFQAARQQLLRQGVPEAELPPQRVGFAPADFGRERVARKGLERLAWEAERFEPVALSVYSGATPKLTAVYAPPRVPKDVTAGDRERVSILAGGDPFRPTVPVSAGVLSAVPAPAPAMPDGFDGRRKALADWVVSEGNPLAPRAMANRVWQWHFGRGIAANPNNLGATGGKPTHPDLLDFLAAEFVARGWSVKGLHRLILTSAAYRRSAAHPHPAALAAADPDGASYAAFRPRRLTAEELRDAALAATGELNRAVGGVPVRPEMNPDAAHQPRQVMGTFAPPWEPSPRPDQRHRRSLYALQLRGLRDPAMEAFDRPPPDLSCECRESSTVAPQALALLNSAGAQARAVTLAARVNRETTTAAAAIDRAFALCYGRPPTAAERAACVAHWGKMTARHATASVPKPARVARLERTAVEENTGTTFTFTQTLHAAADFVPDLHPADVDADTRGLADVCLVLLNANEFVYVY